MLSILILLLVLGVILGSFINALVWRLHEQTEREETDSSKPKQTSKIRNRDLSIVHGRSMCPHCSHTLAAKDLVPIFSWLSLRGKCRYCKKPISAQYPIVELLTGILFVVAYASHPFLLDSFGVVMLVYTLIYIVFFVALAVYDLHWYVLPNRLVFPLTVIAATQVVLVAVWQHDWHVLWYAVLAATIIAGLFWALFEVSKGTWIGGGDVKLAVALGLIVASPLSALLVIFLASLIGTLVSLPILGAGKKGFKTQVPFGPPLLAATLLLALFGSQIVNWYQGLMF